MDTCQLCVGSYDSYKLKCLYLIPFRLINSVKCCRKSKGHPVYHATPPGYHRLNR
ncbi:hypothetical protein HanPSC8_Chr06g0235051 [Helianthus annuus]|nr:hypothetical protein HanPSC8_Chr06g0235051 [Helianthus annuus]